MTSISPPHSGQAGCCSSSSSSLLGVAVHSGSVVAVLVSCGAGATWSCVEPSAANSGQPRAPNVRYNYLNPDVALNANPDIAVRCRELTKTYGTGASSVVALRGIDSMCTVASC